MKLKDYLQKALELSVKLDEIETDICALTNHRRSELDICALTNHRRSELAEDYRYLQWVADGEPAGGMVQDVLDSCETEAAVMIRDSLFVPKLNELRSLLNSDLKKGK